MGLVLGGLLKSWLLQLVFLDQSTLLRSQLLLMLVP
jgi:hypothetical protein